MKKICLIFVLSLLLFLTVGCSGSKFEEPSTIGDQYIFSVTDDSYYVYFYEDNSETCKMLYPVIYNYCKKAYDSKKLDYLYMVNLHPANEDKSIIYKPFENKTGQGSTGDFYVNGVSNFSLLCITSAPCLIKVTTKDGKKVATLVTDGATAIENYLNGLTK